jgi:hypothetical protein
LAGRSNSRVTMTWGGHVTSMVTSGSPGSGHF